MNDVDDHVARAFASAEQKLRSEHATRIEPHAARIEPHERTSMFYRELCRLDSGCQRTGSAADCALPPCRATRSFRDRRRCSV